MATLHTQKRTSDHQSRTTQRHRRFRCCQDTTVDSTGTARRASLIGSSYRSITATNTKARAPWSRSTDPVGPRTPEWRAEQTSTVRPNM